MWDTDWKSNQSSILLFPVPIYRLISVKEEQKIGNIASSQSRNKFKRLDHSSEQTLFLLWIILICELFIDFTLLERLKQQSDELRATITDEVVDNLLSRAFGDFLFRQLTPEVQGFFSQLFLTVGYESISEV